MKRLAEIRTSPLAGPLGWSALSFGTKALTGLGVFVLIARHYGPTEFGVYAGTVALVSLFTGFALLGSAELAAQTIKNTTNGDGSEAGLALSQIARLCLTVMPAVLIAVSLGGAVFFPSIGSFWFVAGLIAVLGFGEFAVHGVVEALNAVFVAAEHHRQAAVLSSTVHGGRLLAAAVVVAIDSTRLMTLALLLALVGISSIVAGLVLAVRLGHRVRWIGRPSAGRRRDGFDLALAGASRKTLHSADQSVLLRSGFVSETGHYGVGARIVQYAFLPVMIVLQVTYPKYFEHGADGIGASARFGRRVAPPLVAYGVAAAFVIYFSRLLVQPVLGDEYAGAAPVLASLCLLPLIRIVASIFGDILISSGHVSSRTRPVVAAAVANLGLNLLLIPHYSWQAAVATTYVADVGLVAVYAVLIHRLRKAEQQTDTPASIPTHVHPLHEEHKVHA